MIDYLRSLGVRLSLAAAVIAALPAVTAAQIRIEQRELLNLLENDATAADTLERYFQLSDDEPFAPKLKLREGVEVVVDPNEPQLAIRDWPLRVSNMFGAASKLKKYFSCEATIPRVVAEGDSWFNYPWPGVTDVTDELSAFYCVYPLAAAGDEITNMFSSNQFLPALASENAKVLLLSGGGNDLLGHIGDYLNSYAPGMTAPQLLNKAFFEKLSQLENVYRSLFEILAVRAPAVTVITHGYDYAVPGAKGKTKYLSRPLVEKGVTGLQLQTEVIHVVIDALNDGMSALNKQHKNAVFVDLRGTVGGSQWMDEIHPDNNGFQQVAIKLMDKIRLLVGK